MDNEIWKPIPGFEEYYHASSLGRIKQIKRRKGTQVGRILKAISTPKSGYLGVGLSGNSKGGRYSIHRLVAMAFHDNPENKPCVNHINGIKTDNRAENLEWVTYEENMQHAYSTGLVDKKKLSESHKKENLSEEVQRKQSESHKGKHHTEATRRKMSEAHKGLPRSEEYRRHLSEAKKGVIWINNGIENRRVKPEKLQEYLDRGYICGFKRNRRRT